MELEKDYILRMIRDLVKSIAHLILGKSEIDYKLPDKSEFTKLDNLYVRLMELVNKGQINEAEDMLFEEIDTSNMKYFEMAMAFYLYLNDFADIFLEGNNYSREEIKEGILSICKEFGVSSMVEFLF